MRKSLGVLLAVGMLTSMIAIGAAPAGAAGGTVCKTLVSVGTITPGLPPLSSTKTAAKVVTKATGTFGGCTGGGVTSGAFKLASVPASTPGNCKSLLSANKPGAKNTSGTGSITWKPKGSSTFTFQLLKSVPAGVTQTFSATITGGLFKGSKATQKFSFAAVPKTGCVSTPLVKVAVTAKSTLVIK